MDSGHFVKMSDVTESTLSISDSLNSSSAGTSSTRSGVEGLRVVCQCAGQGNFGQNIRHPDGASVHDFRQYHSGPNFFSQEYFGPDDFSPHDTGQYYQHGVNQNNWRFFDPSESRKQEIRWKKPLLFYLLTWLSTTLIGYLCYSQDGSVFSGLMFSAPLMTILTLHELGHYLQTVRYGVRSTLPLFIPLPFPPFGTLGAIIRMDSRIPNLRALYDIGISGPLAGLAATLVFMVIGISLSSVQQVTVVTEDTIQFGMPLLFQWVARLFFDFSVPGSELCFHPIAMAAWTGLFLTSLNLLPLGQLDGGHVFYSLLKRHAGRCSFLIFLFILGYVIIGHQWNWTLFLVLILIIGVAHPPTGNDSVSLGWFRTILGWGTLLFVIIGFTPNPIIISEPTPKPGNDLKPVYSQVVIPDEKSGILVALNENIPAQTAPF